MIQAGANQKLPNSGSMTKGPNLIISQSTNGIFAYALDERINLAFIDPDGSKYIQIY